MYRNVKQKIFHSVIISIIIIAILCVGGMFILRYQVEGESNMPFKITKISIIESVEGMETEGANEKWNFNVNQNNDIYIYIEKNKSYTDKEAINHILIDNINVQKNKEIGTINFYRPNKAEQGGTFANTEENLIQNIEYKGTLESNLKKLEIANQGGIVVFRYANDKVAEYTSNDEVINHNELLKKANVNEEDLKGKISFDFTIVTESGKEYKANMSFDLPVNGVVENGTTSQEITDVSNIIFKRTKN